MPPIQFVVDRREAGKTLAAALKARYGLSWAAAKRLVEKRHVKVSGQVETDVARRLKLGKRVELESGTVEAPAAGGGDRKRKGEGVKGRKGEQTPVPKPAPAPAKPKVREKKPASTPAHPMSPALPADCIVYSDDALVVVNKPVGLTTMRHEEEVAEFGDRGKRFLTKTLAGLLPALLGAPGRPVFAVHRIDRDTSGLVVFARTRAAADDLTKQFRKHTVDRRYQALTRGVPAPGRVESVLVRDRGDGRRGSARKPDVPDGKRAVTHVKVLESFGAFALAECRLETGRTHQVRIHLGEAGTPLCGESVYDRPVNGKPAPDASGAKRPMLHAGRLGFNHPETGEPMSWDVPPPEDFAKVLKQLRGRV